MRIAIILPIVGLALVLVGCATPLGLFGLDPKQMAAAAKDDKASALCVEVGGMLTTMQGRIVVVTVDRHMTARVAVGEKCATVMEAAK